MAEIIRRFTRSRADRDHAAALEHALERLDRYRERGVDDSEARRRASAYLGPTERELFSIAASLPSAARAMPEPAYADRLERRLREAASGVVSLDERRSVRRRGVPYVAAAACFMLILGLLYGGMRSIPGDVLNPVKDAVEATQLGVTSGTAEARLRVRFAQRRFDEVDALVRRARAEAIHGSPGSVVAAVAGITDPRLARLIHETLQEAEAHIEAAAPVLIATRDAEGLDELVEVTRKGRRQVSEAADELPDDAKLPLIDTGHALEEIEQQAEAARASLPQSPRPTPTPCVDPTPTPTASPTPSPTPSPSVTPSPSPTPTPTSDASGRVRRDRPTPTPSPTPTPCATASPTPSPAPTPTPTPRAPSPSPTPRPTAEPAADDPSPQPTPSAEPQASTSSGCWWLADAVGFC